MREAGYQFEVMAPHESAECGLCSKTGPAGLVAELALRKAANIAGRLASDQQSVPIDCILIACDTVAECEGEILGKPKDEDHARQMLLRLSGSSHRVFSGLCVWLIHADHRSAQPEVRIATTELKMDVLPDESMETYLASGLWQGKAGAFGYQDRPGWLRITRGSESNVIGLPMELLVAMLEGISFEP